MDIVEIAEEKRFLGQEFLTWLWWKSEERGGSVALEDRGDILVVFEKHMLLESGEGESAEKLICSGLQAELQEARTGLRVGKKLEQARIQLTHDAYQYNFTLTGASMDFRNVRLPKTAETEKDTANQPEEVEGAILERIFLFENLVRIVHALFAMFLQIRLGDAWRQEAERIRSWISRAAAA